MRNKTVVFSLMLLCIIRLESVQVKKIDVSSFSHFQLGTLKGTNLDSNGVLFLGPNIQKIQGPDREYFLSLDVSQNGMIYVGTGHKGSIFKIDPSGTSAKNIVELFSGRELDIHALVVTHNDDIIAGSSPNGRLYKITKEKKVTEVFNPDEKYIWDLKEDQKGNIICAVGGSGAIYRISSTGGIRKIFAGEDAHIISLFIGKDNSILAGSGDRGVIYKIENSKIKVLHDSPLDEIRGICEDSNGTIYFSATKGISDFSTSKDTAFNGLFKVSRPRRLKPPPKEKSILYRIGTNGTVETIWSSTEEYIYTLAYDKKNGGVIVGTGNSGRMYRISKDGSFSYVYESESAQIYKIVTVGNRFVMAGNNTASLAQIEDTPNSKGEYLSQVFDLGIRSKIGRIYWESSIFAGSTIRFFVRAGNSNVPDNTWLQWSPPFNDSENSTINFSEEFRYLQVKSVLNSTATAQSPQLKNFTVYYIQANLKPKLENIRIKPGSRVIKKKGNSKGTNLFKKNLMLSWSAKDPNKDRLIYKVSLKKNSDRRWIVLKEDLKEDEFRIETELFEDGKYVARVIANDSLDNPPSLAKSDQKISTPFIIDSTAPTLNQFMVNKNTIGFEIVDKTSRIGNVLFSLNGKDWFPVFPVDRINDSKHEKYSLNLQGMKTKGIVFIKAIDEFRNYKVFQREL